MKRTTGGGFTPESFARVIDFTHSETALYELGSGDAPKKL
jgi:hypothetical protein